MPNTASITIHSDRKKGKYTTRGSVDGKSVPTKTFDSLQGATQVIRDLENKGCTVTTTYAGDKKPAPSYISGTFRFKLRTEGENSVEKTLVKHNVRDPFAERRLLQYSNPTAVISFKEVREDFEESEPEDFSDNPLV